MPSAPVASLSPREQFERYADALFPDVFAGRFAEIRAINTWTSRGKKIGHLEANLWLRPSEFKASFDSLSELNETANIFVGVNLRSMRLGTKDSIKEAYCITADMDYCTPEAALLACQSIGLPEPSMLVSSGHGAHIYYLFDVPYQFRTPRDLSLFEAAARGFQRASGADATSDITRLLRIPGYLNTKELVNGATPVPCALVNCEPARRFSPELFMERWRPEEKRPQEISFVTNRPHDARTERRIAGLIRHLANDQVTDRSRRDFGVLAGLLRLGLSSPDEIWSLVKDYSKFETDGERYFETTLRNAQRAVGEGESFFD